MEEDYRPQSHKNPEKCEFIAQPRSWALKVWKEYQTWDKRRCTKSLRLGNRTWSFYVESPLSKTVYLLSADGEWIARFSDHWAWRVGDIETYSCHKVKSSYIDIGTRSKRSIRGVHVKGYRPFVLGIKRRFSSQAYV